MPLAVTASGKLALTICRVPEACREMRVNGRVNRRLPESADRAARITVAF